MGCYAGLDVSLEMTSICVVALDGKVLREGKALSEPEAIIAFLRETGLSCQRQSYASASRSRPCAGRRQQGRSTLPLPPAACAFSAVGTTRGHQTGSVSSTRIIRCNSRR